MNELLPWSLLLSVCAWSIVVNEVPSGGRRQIISFALMFLALGIGLVGRYG